MDLERLKQQYMGKRKPITPRRIGDWLEPTDMESGLKRYGVTEEVLEQKEEGLARKRGKRDN